jgi:hypothetical protein
VACVGVGEATAFGVEDGVEAGDEHVLRDACQQRLVDLIKVNDGDIQDTANGGNDRDSCTGDRDLGSDNAVGDPAPAGGPDEDIKDNLDSCENKTWVNGNFYNQT